MKTLKIDKFTIIFIAALSLLAILIAFTLNTIFASVNTAKDLDTTIAPQVNNDLTINGVILNKALKAAFQKEYVVLDLK